MVVFTLLGRLYFLSPKYRELVWGQGSEAAVRAEVIVVVAPCFDDLACLGETEEHVLIKAFISQPTVEALDEGVLYRLAGLNVVPCESSGGPAQHRTTGQLGSIVHQEAVMADD